MSTSVSYEGTSYTIPETGERNWGGSTKVDGFLVAVASNILQKSGGNFTLTSDVDFGAAAGIKVAYLKSRSATIASSGLFRLANDEDGMVWRDNADSADLALKVNTSDNLEFNGNALLTSTGALTASRMVVTDGTPTLTTNAVTATEAGYLSGVTSAIQTQLNAKASSTHASTHITGQSDEIDGDKLDIDWTPTNYTPSTTPTEADNADNLTAHLYGIDQILGILAAPGLILPYGGTSAPSGFLLCDGSAVSRTTYAALYAVVGNAFGEGDGSTTFNLPDLRGRFLRGLDAGATNDPDAASRTAMATGGNTGDNIGSIQDHAFQGHYHEIKRADNGQFLDPKGDNTNAATGRRYADNATEQSGSPQAQDIITDGTNGTPNTTSETRPVNASVNFIIKT